MKHNIKKAGIITSGVAALAALALPVFTVSAVTGTTTINGTVGSAITMSTTPTVNLNVTPTASGATSTASGTVTVSTNDVDGYNLAIESNTGSTDLVNGSYDIPASSGTPASPTALATNTWGWRVDGAGSFGAGPSSAVTNQASYSTTFAGMPAQSSPYEIKSTSTTASSDVTTVWYGMRADSTKETGTYTNSVLYTALTN